MNIIILPDVILLNLQSCIRVVILSDTTGLKFNKCNNQCLYVDDWAHSYILITIPYVNRWKLSKCPFRIHYYDTFCQILIKLRAGIHRLPILSDWSFMNFNLTSLLNKQKIMIYSKGMMPHLIGFHSRYTTMLSTFIISRTVNKTPIEIMLTVKITIWKQKCCCSKNKNNDVYMSTPERTDIDRIASSLTSRQSLANSSNIV